MTDAISQPALIHARRSIPEDAREYLWELPDGWPLRRLDLAGKGTRGSLLFMPGRGDCYEKWLEALNQWADPHMPGGGWKVSAADWRGQAGSGRLGKDPTTGHVADFAQWIEDFAALWADWSAGAQGPRVLVAHSMGGHLALRAVAEGRVRPDALVVTAPMLGIHPTFLPSNLLQQAAKVMCAIGDPTRPAWKTNEKPELLPHDRSFLLTHDAARFADEEWWRRIRPELAMGPASWGWIERALASIRKLEAPGVLEAVEVPVLLLATRADGLVSWPAIRRAAARLPHGELVAFGRECRHEILREVDPVRIRALDAIRGFLDRTAPARG